MFSIVHPLRFIAIWLVEIDNLSTFGQSVKWPLFLRSLNKNKNYHGDLKYHMEWNGMYSVIAKYNFYAYFNCT